MVAFTLLCSFLSWCNLLSNPCPHTPSLTDRSFMLQSLPILVVMINLILNTWQKKMNTFWNFDYHLECAFFPPNLFVFLFFLLLFLAAKSLSTCLRLNLVESVSMDCSPVSSLGSCTSLSPWWETQMLTKTSQKVLTSWYLRWPCLPPLQTVLPCAYPNIFSFLFPGTSPSSKLLFFVFSWTWGFSPLFFRPRVYHVTKRHAYWACPVMITWSLWDRETHLWVAAAPKKNQSSFLVSALEGIVWVRPTVLGASTPPRRLHFKSQLLKVTIFFV